MAPLTLNPLWLLFAPKGPSLVREASEKQEKDAQSEYERSAKAQRRASQQPVERVQLQVWIQYIFGGKVGADFLGG